MKSNNLENKNPKLAKEWNFSKNGKLKPSEVALNSHHKVWWKCSKGHEWEATVNNRNKGRGCPYCSNKKLDENNNFAKKFPEIAEDWNYKKNGQLQPQQVAPKSSKLVWWRCKNGHEWKTSIGNRAAGKGCPFCANQKVDTSNSLATLNSSLAKEWHPTKNKNLNPDTIGIGSGKRVWWLCPKGHEFQGRVNYRNLGGGCPICSHQQIVKETSFSHQHPELMKEWNFEKNKKINPEKVGEFSGYKAWWQCNNGHEWEVAIAKRSAGSGCPYCANQKVTDSNSLTTINPDLAKEWHPSKNGNLSAKKVVFGSSKKVWWKCKKGHEWQATVVSRNKGVGCPFCNKQTSSIELAIFLELQHIFGSDVKQREKIDGIEADILISKYKYVVEFDGSYWHRNRGQKDLLKNRKLEEKGFIVHRVRGIGLEKISDHDLIVNEKDGLSFLISKSLLENLLSSRRLEVKDKNNVDAYLKNKTIKTSDKYNELLKVLPGPLPGKSFADKRPDLVKEWHKTKNDDLKPSDFAPQSSFKVWWQCKSGHEWQATVSNRYAGKGCPYCSGLRISEENNFGAKYPKLLKEWDYKKNKLVDPYKISSKNSLKVWWKCKKKHMWQASIGSRAQGAGCPYCSGNLVPNRLQEVKKIAKSKGGKCLSKEYKSNKIKLHFQCKYGHEWDASAGKILIGRWCPKCAGTQKKTIEDMKQLAKKYNGSCLSVKYISTRTPLTWECKFGHKFMRAPAEVKGKSFCTKCSGYEKNIDDMNLLASKYGGKCLSKKYEGAKTKLIWQCANGHAWNASPTNIQSGTWCPICARNRGK